MRTCRGCWWSLTAFMRRSPKSFGRRSTRSSVMPNAMDFTARPKPQRRGHRAPSTTPTGDCCCSPSPTRITSCKARPRRSIRSSTTGSGLVDSCRSRKAPHPKAACSSISRLTRRRAMPRPRSIYGRRLDISAVLGLLEQRIKEVMLSHRTESGQLSFMGRKLRNMYKRLAEAWGIRSERLAERKRRDAAVEIAVGSSACHYFSGNGAEFEPEASEIELRQGGNVSGGQGLSLMATNDSPWLSEDQTKRLTTGIIQPRASQFAAATPL